jgi:hypothetical protein
VIVFDGKAVIHDYRDSRCFDSSGGVQVHYSELQPHQGGRDSNNVIDQRGKRRGLAETFTISIGPLAAAEWRSGYTVWPRIGSMVAGRTGMTVYPTRCRYRETE